MHLYKNGFNSRVATLRKLNTFFSQMEDYFCTSKCLLLVLLQVRPRESEDQNILPCHRHMDVWCHSLGDVHTWSGAVAGPQWEPGKHAQKKTPDIQYEYKLTQANPEN